MSEIVQRELIINGEIPQDVKNRVRENLKDHPVDCSDIPELPTWLPPPTIIKVTFDAETTRSLRAKAAAKHQTPAQVVGDIVRKELQMA